jgi:DNA-binding transcriptional MerR regulator
MVHEDLLTVSAAARLAEVAENTIRSWERRGWLPVTRTTSGLRLFTRDDVLRIAERQRAAR